MKRTTDCHACFCKDTFHQWSDRNERGIRSRYVCMNCFHSWEEYEELTEAAGELVGHILIGATSKREVRITPNDSFVTTKNYNISRPQPEWATWGIGGHQVSYHEHLGPIFVGGMESTIFERTDFLPLPVAQKEPAPDEAAGGLCGWNRGDAQLNLELMGPEFEGTLIGHVPGRGGVPHEVWRVVDPQAAWYLQRTTATKGVRSYAIRSTDPTAIEGVLSRSLGPIFVKAKDAWALEQRPGFRAVLPEGSEEELDGWKEPPPRAQKWERERYKACPGCGQWPCSEGYIACAAGKGIGLYGGEDVALTLRASEIQSEEELPYPDDVAEAGIPLRPKVSP